MRQALLLTAALLAAFLMIEDSLGYRIAAAAGFGVTVVISIVNTLTFLWLWWARTTPLALGMAFNWFGQTALSVWWYTEVVPTFPDISGNAPLVFLLISFYIVGGALHISVMQRSMEFARSVLIWPIVAAVAAAAAASMAL